MISYKERPEEFKSILINTTGVNFAEYIIRAIESKEKLNYFDRLPRYILQDTKVDEKELLLVFDDGSEEKIIFSEVQIKQANSINNKFYLNEDVIIFQC